MWLTLCYEIMIYWWVLPKKKTLLSCHYAFPLPYSPISYYCTEHPFLIFIHLWHRYTQLTNTKLMYLKHTTFHWCCHGLYIHIQQKYIYSNSQFRDIYNKNGPTKTTTLFLIKIFCLGYFCYFSALYICVCM